MEQARRKSPFAYLAFPLFIALLFALVFIFRDELWGFFQDRNAARDWIRAQGFWGPVAYIGLQVIQVVIFIIPGEVVQVAGGYAFGFWLGSLYTLIGVTLGSIVNFFAGRLLGRPFVESLFAPEKIERIEDVIGSGKGAAGLFLLFVIPGIPKDLLCYVAGISALSLPSFFAVSMAGRLPGILGSAYMGSAAYIGSYGPAIALLAAAALLFALGLAFKERIQVFIAKILRRGGGGEK
jgi:uncharacterized membrane protein YdjX (TVP38/TMEM64 family)